MLFRDYFFTTYLAPLTFESQMLKKKKKSFVPAKFLKQF